MKGAVIVDGIDSAALADYAAICGHLLAKGHARTSGASMIAATWRAAQLDEALARFAQAYADQTERDHAALVGGRGPGCAARAARAVDRRLRVGRTGSARARSSDLVGGACRVTFSR